MHTHDEENHDNLYADEGAMSFGETNADAQRHVRWAIGTSALMLLVLGVVLNVS